MSQTDELFTTLASILSSGDVSRLDSCLDGLDREAPIETPMSPQEALLAFKAAHCDLLSAAQPHVPTPMNPRRRFGSRWAQFAASIAVTFVLSTCVAQAGLWEDFANWTKEVFSFGATQTASPSPSVPTIAEVMGSLDDDGVKFPREALPGYELVSTLTDHTKNSSLAYSTYNDPTTGQHYIVSARHFESAEYARNCLIEKTAAAVETYQSNGVAHYIMSNSDTVTATWVNGPYLCTINGTISLYDLRTLLESIYI